MYNVMHRQHAMHAIMECFLCNHYMVCNGHFIAVAGASSVTAAASLCIVSVDTASMDWCCHHMLLQWAQLSVPCILSSEPGEGGALLLVVH